LTKEVDINLQTTPLNDASTYNNVYCQPNEPPPNLTRYYLIESIKILHYSKTYYSTLLNNFNVISTTHVENK